MARAKKPAAKQPSQVYRFKITLLDVKPPIWRRIEVADGTLDELHEHIQTAMGWTNSHLHQFDIGGRRYGDPELLDDGWGDRDFVDSTKLRLNKLLDKKRKSFRFHYEYDFGDGWRHEIIYEGVQPAEPGAKYPRCTEGARACPPEDCGGPWGYMDFLEAIRDPKHESHDDLLEWIGGEFDSEAFDLKEANKEMRRGLPNWRDYR
ncbi:MAG TPA: plasmid pRiA4b ORF-3 family protein [Pirellulales bacterium]|nr:plasmid pRiA4b ORF-3 family protein [Pirellulales bacterium]